MKKKLLSLAVAAIAISSLAPLAASAQAPADNAACARPTECPRKDKCGKDRQAPNPFACVEGLTADQQAKLDALRAERQKAREARREANRKARGERQKADSTERAARREARQAERRAYLDQVKAILTPEQYTAWLENMAFNKPGRDGKGFRADGKGHRGHRDGKGRRGHRGGCTKAVCPAARK